MSWVYLYANINMLITLALGLLILILCIWISAFGDWVTVLALTAIGIGILYLTGQTYLMVNMVTSVMSNTALRHAATTSTVSPVTGADESTAIPAEYTAYDDADLMQNKEIVGAGVSVGDVIKTILRNAKKAMTTAAAGTAVVASGGFGGDTIVNILMLALDATVYIGSIAVTFLTNTSAAASVLKQIYDVNFDGGVEGVRLQMNAIMQSPVAISVRGDIKAIFMESLVYMSNLLGDVLNTVIPDSAAITGWGVSEMLIAAIQFGATHIFSILNAIYTRIMPAAGTALLAAPETMRASAIGFINYIIGTILPTDATWVRWATVHAGRQALVNTAALASLFVPVVGIPLAAWVVTSGTITNVVVSSGLGKEEIVTGIRDIYTKVVHVPGYGDTTALDAAFFLMKKVTPLIFAMLYVVDTDASTNMPADPVKIAAAVATAETASKVRSAQLAASSTIASARAIAP